MKSPKLNLPAVIVHQEAGEHWTRLEDDGVEALKGQIRAELRAPRLPVIVLPPGCSLDFVTDLADDIHIDLSGAKDDEDEDEDEPNGEGDELAPAR